MSESIIQNICISSYNYSGYWRNDSILETPLPFYPREGANICLEPSISYPSAIDIIWLPSAGATEYILELADNPSFDGPSLRAVITTNTNYVLQKDVDIRMGQQLYWRVFSRNGIGGVSQKSIPRLIKYECPTNALDKNPAETTDRCTNFDVKLAIHGDDYMKCCESKMWSLEFSYTSKDQLGNQLLSIDSIDWTISSSAGASKPTITNKTNDYVVIESCGATPDDSQIFEIQIRVTFVDLTTLTTFDCTAQKKVFLDCHAGPAEQPWAKAIRYDYLLSMPKHFYSPIAYEPYVRGYFQPSYCYCDMLIAAGPVFKVPIPVPACPQNYIQTSCCECVPPWIPFQIESDFGVVGGTLVWNGSKWTFTDNRESSSSVCPTVQLNLELECDGTEFRLSGTEICGTPCTGSICAGRTFRNDTVSLSYEAKSCDTDSPIGSGVLALNRGEFEGQWNSNNISACDDDCIYYVQLRLEEDPPKIYVKKFCFNDGDPTDVTLNPTGEFDSVVCGPTTVTMRIELTDNDDPPAGCCLEFVVTAALCGGGSTRVLGFQDPDDDTFVFSDCKKPDGSINIIWTDPENEDAIPTGATINLGGSLPIDPGCLCQADYYAPIKVERYGLEARINIPLGCGLKSSNGNLTLDPFPIAKLIKHLTGYLDTSGLYCSSEFNNQIASNPCYGYCLWQWYEASYFWHFMYSYCKVSDTPTTNTTTTTCDPQACIEECLVRQYICDTFIAPPEDGEDLGACCYWNGKLDESGNRVLKCLRSTEQQCKETLQGTWTKDAYCETVDCGEPITPEGLKDEDCKCGYPDFCPPDGLDGSVTFTFCGINDPPPPSIECTTTAEPTTTTEPTTTEEPCACPTTPIACGECRCCWMWLPGTNGWGWVLIEDGCSDIGCPPCAKPGQPGGPPLGGNPCDVYSGPGGGGGGGGQPPDPPSCTGECTWVWVPNLIYDEYTGECNVLPDPDSGGGEWRLVSNGCYGGGSCLDICKCEKPSQPGSSNIFCAGTKTICGCGRNGTSEDPCLTWQRENCYSTTSTTSSPTTSSTSPEPTTSSTSSTEPPTTTADPCTLSCLWQWQIDQWVNIDDPCSPACPCLPPAIDAIGPGGIVQSPCLGGTTSTTSPPTTPPPLGACCWRDFEVIVFPFCPTIVCEVLTEQQCVEKPFGVWHEGEDCNPPTPCGSCPTTTSTTIGPTTAPPATGACCVGETCVPSVTNAYCTGDLGGTYLGDGTLCTSVSCVDCVGDCLYDWNGVSWVFLEESTCDCMCFPPTTPAPGFITNPYNGTCNAL